MVNWATDWTTSWRGDTALPWAVDGTSGKAVPTTSGQWTSLIDAAGLGGVVAVPSTLYLCQEASGNLTDSIGGLTLTANATPLYQQTVSGWERKAVGFNGVASQRFLSAGFPNASTNSIMALIYASYPSAPGSATYILNYGTGDDASMTCGSTGQQTFRYREGANINQCVSLYTGPTAFPVSLKRDVTGSAVRLYTDSEKLSPTFGAAAATTNFSLGAASGTSSTINILYAATWNAANGEISDANWKTLLQQMGWTITWS